MKIKQRIAQAHKTNCSSNKGKIVVLASIFVNILTIKAQITRE